MTSIAYQRIDHDKVQFYIRNDFGNKNCIQTKYIIPGDTNALKYYINLFMNTEKNKTMYPLNVDIPILDNAPFVFQ